MKRQHNLLNDLVEDEGGPHWLSPEGKRPQQSEDKPRRTRSLEEIRRDVRARWLVQKHTPGGHEHDQESHGNWSDGPSAEDTKDRDTAKPSHRLTSMAILAEAPQHKPNSRKVHVVAKDLNERAGKILKEQFGVDSITEKTTTPERDDFISDVIAQELRAGLSNGHSSEAWYSDTMQRALTAVYRLHPEIEHDPDKKFIFLTALAITSQGENVDSSARLTNQAYLYYNKNNKFPVDLKVADPSITGNFKKMNAMIALHGIKGTKDIFDREFTVRDLAEATGYKVGKTNLDTKVNGSAILGPKIGLGFYQNLNDNFEPITMDMWFMRSWGRITNTGMGAVDLSENAERLRNALHAEGRRAPAKMEALVETARKIVAEHEKRYAKDSVYRKAKKLESVLAAERLVLNHDGALVETPRGGAHRNWMTRVFRQAIDKLKAEGVKLNPASAQATWWHPEQMLYKRLGVRVRSVDSDYAKPLRSSPQVKADAQLRFANWIDDPDPPDYMTDADIERMAQGFSKLVKLPHKAEEPE